MYRHDTDDADNVHQDNYQDGMVVGMSRMGDGRKRSPASSTRSHLARRKVRKGGTKNEEERDDNCAILRTMGTMQPPVGVT